jgi:hypothetical protein
MPPPVVDFEMPHVGVISDFIGKQNLPINPLLVR